MRILVPSDPFVSEILKSMPYLEIGPVSGLAVPYNLRPFRDSTATVPHLQSICIRAEAPLAYYRDEFGVLLDTLATSKQYALRSFNLTRILLENSLEEFRCNLMGPNANLLNGLSELEDDGMDNYLGHDGARRSLSMPE